MEAVQLYNGLENLIFHFNDAPALQEQCEKKCRGLFLDFWEKVRMSEWNGLLCAKSKVDHFAKMIHNIHWNPKYAAAVWFREIDSLESAVTVVGLDGWKTKFHAAVGHGRYRIAESDPLAPALFEMGPFPTAKKSELLEELERELAMSERDHTGDRRHQGSGDGGNQKTPSFFKEMLRKVIDTTVGEDGRDGDMRHDEIFSLQGGTTDVGLHTGCLLRNVSFPLVCSVIRTILKFSGERNDDTFQAMLAIYLISFLNKMPLPAMYNARKIDRFMIIIRMASGPIQKIVNTDLQRNLLEYLTEINDKLKKLPYSHSPSLLETARSVRVFIEKLSDPPLPKMPEPSKKVDLLSKLEQARKIASDNLDWCDIEANDFNGKPQDAWVHLTRLNSYFWNLARQLNKDDYTPDMDDITQYLDTLVSVVKVASNVAIETVLVMKTALKSYEFLAIWISYCWAHKMAEKKFSWFTKYKPALDPNVLQVLVLEYKEAADAATEVREFLEHREKRSSCPFRDSGDTLELALDYGRREGLSLQQMHGTFLEKSQVEIKNRWELVKEKQAELRKLDPQLRQAMFDLSHAEQAECDAKRIYSYYTRDGRQMFEDGYYTAKKRLDDAKETVSRLKSQISQLEFKPATLVFAMPRNRETALQWLFFFYMDPSFEHVAALAHRGQSVLWSKTPNEKSTKMYLHQWFQSHGYFPVTTQGTMVLGSQSDPPSFSTPSIRSWGEETGVYFPDDLSRNPIWLGSHPFDGPDDKTMRMFYTEELPSSPDSSKRDFIRRLVAMLPSQIRENEGIAFRELKPTWLSHEQYHAFSNLRAEPRTQFRNLLESLYENLLPFHLDQTHILVKQAIYQFGERDWFEDLYGGSHNGLELMHECLDRQIEILRDSPRNCSRLQLVGGLLSYFGQYHNGCSTSARNAAEVFQSWSQSLSRLPDDERTDETNAKQAMYHASSLFCLAFVHLGAEDIENIVRYVVLFQNCSLLSRSTVDNKLMQAVSKTMGSHIAHIVDHTLRHPSYLSDVLKLVDNTAFTDGGTWERVLVPSATQIACFELLSKQDCLFTINLLNGIVLFNGSPKHFLPHTIVSDPLFTRTFGSNCNLEVIQVSTQFYRTTRILDGCVYEFEVDSEGCLRIYEYKWSNGMKDVDSKLQLFPRSSVNVPKHLQEPFSHWFSEQRGMILLRPRETKEKDVFYVMTESGTFLVPHRDRQRSVQDLLENLKEYERLRDGSTEFTEALNDTGFEHLRYILVFEAASGDSLRYFLPRYGINFVQTDREIRFLDMAGYSVAKQQHLENTLPGLRCLLVLQKGGRRKVLIPHTVVKPGAQMSVSDIWNEELHLHTYDEHARFKHLVASDTLGRLHLASIYASNASFVPDRLHKKPGADVATNLLRQCLQNEMFTSDERVKLAEVSSHSTLSCSLRLVIWLIWRCSTSLRQPYQRLLERDRDLGYDAFAADQYRNGDFVTLLDKEEELDLFSTKQFNMRPSTSSKPHFPESMLSHIQFVGDVEKQLAEKVVTLCRSKRSFKFLGRSKRSFKFPLDLDSEQTSSETAISFCVERDLRKSYNVFAELPSYSVRSIDIRKLSKEVTNKRGKLQQRLLDELNQSVEALDDLLRSSGEVHEASCADLLRITYDPTHIGCFRNLVKNQRVQADCIGWCLLCVLEDKLGRISEAVKAKNEDALIQELCSVRNWDPVKHPRWVVFEVEQMIQIRPKQYATVDQLLKDRGSVIQLNMGEGKTRVLVPMLIMELCAERKDKAQVNLLPAIFHEALQVYRQCLVASVQNIKLFALPFERSHSLNEISVKIISNELKRCWLLSGCLIVTPQDRNSLLLKQHDAGIMVPGLEDGVIDIFDESDAILDYNFQLVYAIGDQIPLPSCTSRSVAIQTLLSIASLTALQVSTKYGSDLIIQSENVKSGQFANLRIVESTPDAEKCLSASIAAELVSRPPYRFRWILKMSPSESDVFVRLITDAACTRVREILAQNPILERNKEDVLAVRGCLAFGLLFHALKNRYRVSYGLKNLPEFCEDTNLQTAKAPTNIAVPYAASDTPKKRAEFSHPDMALVYTCLSYMHEGLTKSQFLEAMYILTNKSQGLQRRLFQEWIASIQPDIPVDVLNRYNDIQKVDLTNADQVDCMYIGLRRCMKTVFFWMNEVVLPSETHQFPQRRISSAWNLSASGQGIGFSGTDDNRFLLPESIKQISHQDRELSATNGKMLRLILDSTIIVCLLSKGLQKKSLTKMDQEGGSTDNSTLWKILLEQSFHHEVSALIDAGGLMAGAKIGEIIEFVTEKLQGNQDTNKNDFCGFIFFEVQSNKWMVFQFESKRTVPLFRSSIREDQCFVYFDESRCRGTDMKLKLHARAIVTVDKRMTKDKFLQGCARMRNLGPNKQRLIIAGTDESVNEHSTGKSVLESIVRNSILAAQKGLMTFYERGKNFDSFPLPVDDELELEALYAGNLVDYENFGHYLDSHHEKESLSVGMTKLVEYCKSLGERGEVHISKVGQECEKEVEAETEEQEEEEVEIDTNDPYAQKDWDFKNVFTTSNEALFCGGTFSSLAAIIKKKLPALAGINWSKKVYCSPNYFKTVSTYATSPNLALFLRFVSHLVIFKDGRVVLLSAYEMDKLLPHWWRHRDGSPVAALENLFLLTKDGCRLERSILPVSTDVMTTLKLFRGAVDFTDAEKVELKKLLANVPRPHDKMRELLFIRNRLGYFERSDLDEVAYHVGNTSDISILSEATD